MTSIKQLVDRGLELRVQIKALKKELDQIEERLADAALWRDQVGLKDPEREGRRYLAQGSQSVVPVVFTADKIMSRFQDGGPAHERLGLIAPGDVIAEFFKLERVWCSRFDDGRKFRQFAAEMLGQAAPRFVTACLARDKHGIPKSDIKVAWDEAEPVGKDIPAGG